MGTCYSKKASKNCAYSYSNSLMATTKHEDVSRLARPTPYSRNNIPLTPNSKRISSSLPISVKSDSPSDLKSGPMSQSKVNTGLSSSIPRPKSQSGSKNNLSEDLSSTDPNCNSQPKDAHILNNNVLTGGMTTTTPSRHSSTPNTPNSIKIARARFLSNQTASSKIPAKFTAQITGLPRMQSPQYLSKAASIDLEKSLSKANSETIIQGDGDSHESNDFDSGLGSSLADKLITSKPEDAETLKDVDVSLESSPILPSSKSNVTNKIMKFETINTSADSSSNKKLTSPNGSRGDLKNHTSHSTPTNPNFHYTKPTDAHLKKSLSLEYSQPPSYGSYKNFLSNRKTISANGNFSYWQKTDDKASEAVPKNSSNNKSSKLPSSISSSNVAKTSPRSSSVVKENKLSRKSSQESNNSPLSPVAELENRQFLIDDEIADQPGLISFDTASRTLHDSVSELQALKSKTGDNSELYSSCSSLASDDLMLDYSVEDPHSRPSPKFKSTNQEDLRTPNKRHSVNGDLEGKSRTTPRSANRPRSFSSALCEGTGRLRSTSAPLRPPRQMSVTEADDGCVKLDSSSYRLLCQDLNAVKTMLHRLKGVIYEAETLNPFDQMNSKNVFYQSLAYTDVPAGCTPELNSEDQPVIQKDTAFIQQENADLRRQLVLLQQQLEDKDRTIHLLQQQMMKYAKISDGEKDQCTSNSATQTEKF